MILEQKEKKPYISVWFGNFYRPAYDDREFVKEAVSLIKEWGFNSVRLDSKDWEDFRERFAGGEPSEFVAMQEFIQQELKRQGLSHEFLALYLNGDNLYPNIRFSPPVYGESVTKLNGEDGKWYRYWSDKAKACMTEHVRELLENYGDNHTLIELEGSVKKPLCSMWDPIVAPSFDEEGRSRYLNWLSEHYDHDIRKLNQAYQTDADSFLTLKPEDYWFEAKYGDNPDISGDEFRQMTQKVRMMADNKRWKSEELELYFKDMQKRLKETDPGLYLCPNLAQWGYFLTVDGAMLSGVGMADLWDTAVRGIDIYRLAEYVDSTNFISVPVTPYGDPDAYVTAFHHNVMRNMNRDRDFLGGIYWGRFLYNHIYETITPCEIIASIVASQAAGYTSYGMCGLDDGGVLHRMEPCFNESLKRGNAWAKEVIPLLGKLRRAETAILFPQAMALYESMQTDGNKERRLDTLGYYKSCCDSGAAVDIIDREVVKNVSEMMQYKVLILACDDCYLLDRDEKLERAVREFVERGGWLLHGPYSQLAEMSLEIKAIPHQEDAVFFKEKGMLKSIDYCTYEDGVSICTYLSDGKPAVIKRSRGKGTVYSFGFNYGYSYIAKISPHVPLSQKNNELYPINMMKKDLLNEILISALNSEKQRSINIETAEFDNGKIVINHTSYPCGVEEEGEKVFQYPIDGKTLLPHSAVFIKYARQRSD